ncbi:MAG TPA: SPFH domain-containing protein [bacterium]|nr:SPFH domain-containing protein [bacterium]
MEGNPVVSGPLFFILLVGAVIYVARAVKIVRPFEKGLIERLGRFAKTAEPGLTVLFPPFENMRKVDMREQVIDVPPQEVITKDNVVVTVDAVIYFHVTDAFKVVYNVARFELAALKLAQTNLRNTIGELDLDQTLNSRERINTQLREILDEATDKWGVKVTRVEIQKIDPPADIVNAMSAQMKAERTKRAAIIEAEGIKQAAITKAEGEKQSAILEAEGQAGAIERVASANKFQKIALAEGEAQAVTTVFKAIHEGNPTQDLLALKYMEMLGNVADGQATKIFLPLEASGTLGALSTIAEAFKTDLKSQPKK